ncbi:MAG: acyl--CoA ligase [Sphingomonadales bacterium]|nr:acyl--CoA ligase [Sphingomonadales bacterium]
MMSRYTFEEFYQRASNLSRRLIDDYGVKPWRPGRNWPSQLPEWALAFAAITSIGGIVAGLNAWWESDELEYGIRHIGAKVAIVDQERLDRVKLQSGLDFLTLISVRSEPCDRATPIDQLLRQHGELPDIQIEPDDDAVILFTSGSTGHPKGSVSTHRNIIAALLSWELDLAVWQQSTVARPKGNRSRIIRTQPCLACRFFTSTDFLLYC